MFGLATLKLDGIVADFIETSIDRAEENGSGGLVLQVNSTTSVIDDDRLVELAQRIATSEVPIYGWVGPSGAKAHGEVAQLLAATDEIGVAVGAEYGNVGELVIPADLLMPEFVEVAGRKLLGFVAIDNGNHLGPSDVTRDCLDLGHGLDSVNEDKVYTSV